MVIGVNCYVTSWLIIAKYMIVTVAERLASAELYVNVTKNVLVTVS